MQETRPKIYKYTNCRLLQDTEFIDADLFVEAGKVISGEDLFFVRKLLPDYVIDCNGKLIVPGFIDLQINGGFGYDFSVDTGADEAIKTVAKGILAHGVVAFLPTIISSPTRVYAHALKHCAPTNLPHLNTDGATVLGAHVEGPFISSDKRGAHAPEHLRSLEDGMEGVRRVYTDLSHVRMVTLAPEIAGACSVTAELRRRHIVVALGHTNASVEQAQSLYSNGCRFMTHVFNAMTNFHHRSPGVLGLLTAFAADDHTACACSSQPQQQEQEQSQEQLQQQQSQQERLYFGLIVDGVHTHACAVRLLFRTNRRAVCLVTDAVAALGLPAGETHSLGDRQVRVEAGGRRRAVLEGTDTLCGSVTPLNVCVRTLSECTGCSLAEAVACASAHPARAMGLYDRKGHLMTGADADFVIIDERVNVLATYIAGVQLYCHLLASGHSFQPRACI